MRTILAIIFMTIATQAHAKDEPLTIEERLPKCIVEATELINRGTSIKSALETSGQPAEHDDVLLVMYAERYFQLYQNAIKKSVDEGELASKIESRLLSTGEPLFRKSLLVESMLKEHWKDEEAISARAEFIAACANNFDGEAKTQANLIEKLENRVISLTAQIMDLKSELKSSEQRFNAVEAEKKLLGDRLKKQKENFEKNIFELLEKVNWLVSVQTAPIRERNNKVWKSPLEAIFNKNRQDLVGCRNALRDKGQLDNDCAFKLAVYLMEADK